jgi:hypothetical protein
LHHSFEGTRGWERGAPLRGGSTLIVEVRTGVACGADGGGRVATRHRKTGPIRKATETLLGGAAGIGAVTAVATALHSGSGTVSAGSPASAAPGSSSAVAGGDASNSAIVVSSPGAPSATGSPTAVPTTTGGSAPFDHRIQDAPAYHSATSPAPPASTLPPHANGSFSPPPTQETPIPEPLPRSRSISSPPPTQPTQQPSQPAQPSQPTEPSPSSTTPSKPSHSNPSSPGDGTQGDGGLGGLLGGVLGPLGSVVGSVLGGVGRF